MFRKFIYRVAQIVSGFTASAFLFLSLLSITKGLENALFSIIPALSVLYLVFARRPEFKSKEIKFTKQHLDVTIEKVFDAKESGKPLEIIYRDEKGDITQRTITVEEIIQSERRDGYYLEAYCHLRKENRTFRLERILETL